MGYNAQKLVRDLPREVQLTASSRRLLDYLALCANEDEFKKQGAYFAFPREERVLADLCFSRATLYRALDQLEFTCGFYLITRRNRDDRRAALFDLHILPKDLRPEAVLARKQSADARLSATRGRTGARKRNTSQNETYFPEIAAEITSQNETEYVSKCDVITSQNETLKPAHLLLNKELEPVREQGGKEAAAPPAPYKPKNKNPETKRRLPVAVTDVLDKHAEMWTAILYFFQGFPFPDKFEDPEAQALMNAGVNHIGGQIRIRGFQERPRDSSFARKEFLEYMRDHDPAYERAVEQTVHDSMAEAHSAKNRARASPG